MTWRGWRETLAGWALGGLLLAALPATAGDLPVFRHALECWPADNYDVIVFHRGPPDSDEHSLLEALEDARRQSFANFVVRSVDVVGAMDDADRILWESQTNAPPPWFVVCAPADCENARIIWSARLTEANVEALVDSPARRKIAERLLQGASAVWLLLECGDGVRDEAAVDLLAGELKNLESQIELPHRPTNAPPMRTHLPLRIDFSLVRVTRNDPAEEFLVEMLLHEAALPATRPIAFPIFGRGRMLAAFCGKDMAPGIIAEVCGIITGNCSCNVKELNPGRDLLLAANWNSIFDNSAVPDPKPDSPVGNSPLASAKEINTRAPMEMSAPIAPPSGSRKRLMVAVALVAGFLVTVTGFIAWRLKCKS